MKNLNVREVVEVAEFLPLSILASVCTFKIPCPSFREGVMADGMKQVTPYSSRIMKMIMKILRRTSLGDTVLLTGR